MNNMAFSANEPTPPQAGTSSAMEAVSSPSPSIDASPNSTNNDSQPRTPFEFWQSFSHHARHVQARKEVVYEDKAAKDAAQRLRQERIFIRSMESDSAVFDIAQSSGISTSEFFGALTRQHPKALGWVPSKFRSSCVIVSFEDASSRDLACAGVTVGSSNLIGTPTLHMESSVYVVHLSGLPLMKRDDLAIAIRDNMYRYGHVLDVKVCTDEFNLLTGKGSVLLDTSPNDREDPISALEHEIHMETRGHKRIVLARWRGMAIHCNYCKKEGHKIAECQKLQARKDRQLQRKLCYICQSPDHLKAECPRNQQAVSTGKRARTEEFLVDPHVPQSEGEVLATKAITTNDPDLDESSSASQQQSRPHSYALRPKKKSASYVDTPMDGILSDSADSDHDTDMDNSNDRSTNDINHDHDMDGEGDGGGPRPPSPTQY